MSVSILVFCENTDNLPPSDAYHALPTMTNEGGWLASFNSYTLPDTPYIGLFMDNSYLVPNTLESRQLVEEYFSLDMVNTYHLGDTDLYCDTIGSADVLYQGEIQLSKCVHDYLVDDIGLQDDALNRLLSILQEQYPPLYDSMRVCLQNTTYLPSLLTVMKRTKFESFISLVTSVSARFFSGVSKQELTMSSMQSCKYLLILLFQAFLLSSNSLSIKRCASLHFNHADSPVYLKLWKDDAVPVVFASNERFAPALGVCLTSLLDHMDENRFYDIVVLESDLSEDSKLRLYASCNEFSHVRLQFYNPKPMLGNSELQKNPTDHISLETYYRFLIADILPEYHKVLYLDCDTVILDDVGKLFDIDLHGNILSAALDPEIPSLVLGADSSMKRYLHDVLGFQDGEPYFQAGVLVIDLQQMRILHSVKQWIALVGERRYRFNDQDLLNKECRGRFQILDMKWNTIVDCNHTRMKIISDGPYSIYKAYTEAREHPSLVHYAGFEKPWNAIDSDFASVFWHYAKKSEFYEKLLSMVLGNSKEKKEPMLMRLFPRGSRRRHTAKQLFYRWLHL